MRTFVTLVCLLAFFSFSHAQKSHGGVPLGLINSDLKTQLKSAESKVVVPKLDRKTVDEFDQKSFGMQRFAAPVVVDYSLKHSGTWKELSNGDRIWTLQLTAQEAKGFVISYKQFVLPKGSRFFMYSPDGKQVKGSYTYQNNRESKTFLTGMIKGDEVVLEYYEPQEQKGKGLIQINRIYQIYNPDEAFVNKYPFKAKSAVMDTGFGASLECHINVNCPLGDDWQDEKRGVVRVMMVLEEGLGWCSGSLMNNTMEDARLYILTAFHCQDGYTPLYDQWRFDFNYEGIGCQNPVEEPEATSFLGCVRRAGLRDSDFLLLEMEDEEIPASVNAYFNGWNHSDNYEPDTGVIIHHPAGDIRKISLDKDQVTIFPFEIGWNTGVTTPPNFHFRAILDEGTMEGGSSGCPLFDTNGHVIGQLNGGVADCEVGITYHGRMAKSWDLTGDSTTRLIDWLDPLSLSFESWDGMENNVPEVITIEGFIKTHTDQGIGNVKLTLTGGEEPIEIYTDTFGYYLFTDIPVGGSYNISIEKDINAANGISALDLLLVQRHVLGLILLDAPYKVIAADANNSGSTTGIDLFQIQKVNLGIDDGFANRPSWIFDPPSLQINNIFTSTVLNDIMGIKIGDVNDSADPHE